MQIDFEKYSSLCDAGQLTSQIENGQATAFSYDLRGHQCRYFKPR